MNVQGRTHAGGDGQPPAPGESVRWLPRSRLRSARRGDRFLTGLTVVTACVLAAAAGLSAWNRHFDLDDLQSAAGDKVQDRAAIASVATAPPPTPAPVRIISPQVPGAPAQPDTAARFVEPAPPLESVAAPPPSERVTIRTTPDGAPIVPPSEGPVVSTTNSSPPPEPSSPLSLMSAPPPAPVAVAPAQPSAPAPQRTAALPTPSEGEKVAVYLDEYPDQKAAAAGLSQKSGAYGKHIGSAGKLTYTRRNGNTWRLRVSNLDQTTAEALCGKLKDAGAPCSVGPN
jgi:hypothetical protein